MEVHAHTHAERKKFTHYLWEFLMLFLAVFCGFLAENQRELYTEHKKAKEYAEMMKEDLLKDTTQLGQLIRDTIILLQAKKNAERVWQMPIEKITWADIETQSNPGLDITPFAWNDASYSQLKSSGNLRLFEDKVLIRKIAQYESLIKGLGFWEESKRYNIRSDYNFRAEANEDIFLSHNPNLNKNISLKKAGYNFDGWMEANLLGKRLFYYELTLREYYSEIKKTATEIISLLNKNYHLK